MPASRPRVLVNCAISLDGKLNPSPGLRKGAFSMSRHTEDLSRMRKLRARVDAIVIGAGNLRADDQDLALADEERARRRAGGEPEPLRIVLTHTGVGLTPDLKFFDRTRGGEVVVAHPASLPEDVRKRLAGVATLVSAGAETVEMRTLLHWLAAERGVSSVLCEGGGILNAAFFAARCVDELYLTICPRILGGFAAPTLVSGPGFPPDALADATLASLERIGDELFLRYDFQWD
jgi:riboflavin-specific deaminase-like protein